LDISLSSNACPRKPGPPHRVFKVGQGVVGLHDDVTALFLNLADMAVIQLVAELHANGQVALGNHDHRYGNPREVVLLTLTQVRSSPRLLLSVSVLGYRAGA
jgi:hypothetical protein